MSPSTLRAGPVNATVLAAGVRESATTRCRAAVGRTWGRAVGGQELSAGRDQLTSGVARHLASWDGPVSCLSPSAPLPAPLASRGHAGRHAGCLARTLEVLSLGETPVRVTAGCGGPDQARDSPSRFPAETTRPSQSPLPCLCAHDACGVRWLWLHHGRWGDGREPQTAV